MHTSCNLPQKYVIPIPTLTWKCVWLSFKQLVCVAGSIIFGIQTWLPLKVSCTNSYVQSQFVRPYFKQIHLIFPVLVFAYELRSPPNVSNTNSYINLGICMTILQTASLCCWQHHLLTYNHNKHRSMKYWFQRRNKDLYECDFPTPFHSTVSSIFFICCIDTTLHRGIQWHTTIIKSKCFSNRQTHY